jgi:hypothetical protein
MGRGISFSFIYKNENRAGIKKDLLIATSSEISMDRTTFGQLPSSSSSRLGEQKFNFDVFIACMFDIY